MNETLTTPQPRVNVTDVCRELIVQHWDRDTDSISAGTLALEMLLEFPDQVHGDGTITYHAFLNFKEIARRELKKAFVDDEKKLEQLDLFGRTLQSRYPTRTVDGEPVYTKLEAMTDEEVGVQISRLESEAESKLEHAQALRQYLQYRKWQRRAKAS